MMGDLLSTLSSATGGTASINPVINEGGFSGAQDSVNNLTEVTTRIAGTEGDIQLSINSDNGKAAYALKYITRFGLGLSLIGMEKDTYFGARLIDVVGSDTLKQELEEAVDI